MRPEMRLITLTLLLCGSAWAQSDRNMIDPDAWQPRQGWQKQGQFWDVKQDNGKQFIRLMKKPVVLQQTIKTDGSFAKVKLSADVRVQDLKKAGRWGTGSLVLKFLDANNKAIKGQGVTKFFHDNQDWQTFSKTLDVPENVHAFEVWLQYRAAGGTVDLADVSLTATELREAPMRASAATTTAAAKAAEVNYDDHAEWYKQPAQKPITQWQADVDPTAYQQTVHVAPDGDGDGSEGQPMGSIKAALEKAGRLIREGIPTRVRLADGVYRGESWFELDAEKLGGQAKDTLLVVEGESREGVQVRGSHVEGFQPGEWELVDKQRNIYRLPWTHTELDPVPVDTWSPAIEPISRHRVMVFINGAWLKPVQLEQYRHEKKQEKYEREHGGISTRRWVTDTYTGFAGLDAMQPGTLAVNTLSPGENEFDNHPHEHPNSLLIRLPEGIDFDSAQVEVAWGGGAGFRFKNKDNVAIRNLSVQHMGIASIYFSRCNNVLAENFEVSNSDGGGGAAAIRFYPVKHLTLRNGTVDHNGMFGVSLAAKFATVENMIVTRNNWRGGLSDHVMHGQGGLGTGLSHMVIRNSKFNHNYGLGIRQDGLAEHVLIENCQANFNLRGGMMWEITYGPVTIRNTEMIGNYGKGIENLCVHGMTLDGCTIVNNNGPQLDIFPMVNRGKIVAKGTPRFSGPMRWPLGGEKHQGYWIEGIIATTIRNCTIAVTDPELADVELYQGRYWGNNDHYFFDWLANQLTANGNTYYHAAKQQAFDIGKASGMDGNYGTLAQWRQTTGEDGYSVWKKPEGEFPAPVKPEIQGENIPLHRQ